MMMPCVQGRLDFLMYRLKQMRHENYKRKIAPGKWDSPAESVVLQGHIVDLHNIYVIHTIYITYI